MGKMDVVYNAYQYYFTKRKYEFQNNNYEAEKNFKTDIIELIS